MLRGCGGALVAVWLCSAGCSNSARRWTARDLGPGRCLALNSMGQAVGVDQADSAFVVAGDGTRTPLSWSDSSSIVVGAALADSGDVAGYSQGTNGRQAMRYSGGAWSAVPGLDLASWSQALGFSDAGDVFGALGDAAGATHGFVVSNGTPATLPLPADKSSAVYAALAGRVAGIVETAGGETHGFVIDGGQLKDLGTLGGTTSAAYAMNRRGDLVGGAETASSGNHAFFSPGGGKLVDLAPAGSTASDARGIDDQRRIAVNALDAAGMSHPSVSTGGKAGVDVMPIDADKRPYVSAHIAAMTADGRMVGWGVPAVVDADGGDGASVRCIVWTP
jgi:probable HAF family extracellular repeat protein